LNDVDTPLRGSEVPRIFVPPLRELTPDTTDGYAAIAFAEDIMGLQLFPWEKWLLIHGLELLDDWTYRFRTVIVSVARQNGKTLVLVILALWHLYAKGSRNVMATAQDLGKAEDTWSAAVEWAEENEELNDLIRKKSLAHPKRLMVMSLLTEKVCEYRVATASRRGPRGFTADAIFLDELREHQSWDTWAAISKTILARPKAQCWCFSNAADALGVVLRYQRALSHRSLGWPDDDEDIQSPTIGELDPAVEELLAGYNNIEVGWFEWSAPPQAARTDKQGWRWSNPSMNWTELAADCITDRAIAHALRTDPMDVFDTEVLCRQIDTAAGGPFPEGSWEACRDDAASRYVAGRKSCVCVEISTTRSAAVIARASLTEDGAAVCGIVDQQPGTDWILPWLLANRGKYNGIVVRTGAGAPPASIAQQVAEAKLPLVEWRAADIGPAFGQLYDRISGKQPDGVTRRTFKHLSHPGLDTAATTAVRKLLQAGGWIIDVLKSPHDVAPLYGVTGAVWGMSQLPDDGPSIYSGPQGRDVLVF
jgi:hypothetical protein